MKQDEFEKMCESLYELTTMQREGLLELLQSRVWYYGQNQDAELNSYDEYDDDSIKMYLSKCPTEFITYVMNGEPEEIRKRFSMLMAENTWYEFERIYEFDNDSIKLVLKETSLVLLSHALKGASDDLRFKISRNMSMANAARLNKKMDALGPVRATSVLIAQGMILDTINALASKEKIELPLSFDHILSKTNMKSGMEENNDPLRLESRVLFTLNDDNVRMLVLEIAPIILVDFLWYLNDTRLTSKVFYLSSPHFANTLIKEWTDRWRNVKIESATEKQLDIGRLALQTILESYRQMVDCGQIYISNEL